MSIEATIFELESIRRAANETSERCGRLIAELSREPTPSPDAPRLVDETEAARILCQAVKTLRNWRSQGCGPVFVKQGRRVTYRTDDLEQWVEQSRRTSTAVRNKTPRRD